MSQNIREKATAILDMANTQGRTADRPCPACGMMMALPESSPQLVPPPIR
jgi:hypothetical protein